LTEEKKFPRRKAAKLTTIRNISPSTDGPVRVLGIVVDSSPGTALIQDIYDSDVEKAGSIWVSVEGSLEVKKKYLIIGEVTSKTVDGSQEVRLNASIAHDVDTLDVGMYKEVLEMEDVVRKAMSG
jgi:hypothetical protein